MNLMQLMAVVAVVASLVLVAQAGARLFPAIALVASGIEALLAFRVISMSVSGVNLALILAIALLVGGGVAWSREGGKTAVTAATAVALIGAIQLAGTLL